MDITLHTVGEPISKASINIIENNLYLGDRAAAKNLNILNKYNINYILTIDTCPLPHTILELKHIKTKFIQLTDQPKEDLLSHFDDTDLFIKEGISHGAVLVHCYYGVSRSASVVIAYVMKKYQLSYHDSFDRVKAKRSIVFPNQGFVSQLELYKHMGYTVNRSNMHYKLHMLSIAADRVRKEKITSQDFMELIQPNPRLEQIRRKSVYRCRKCRKVLASESNLITHSYKNEICKKLFFLEPIAWMNSTSDPLQGKLRCPKCSNKLGFYSWKMGSQCPCGVQVVPAFYLKPSKIDFSVFSKK